MSDSDGNFREFAGCGLSTRIADAVRLSAKAGAGSRGFRLSRSRTRARERPPPYAHVSNRWQSGKVGYLFARETAYAIKRGCVKKIFRDRSIPQYRYMAFADP